MSSVMSGGTGLGGEVTDIQRGDRGTYDDGRERTPVVVVDPPDDDVMTVKPPGTPDSAGKAIPVEQFELDPVEDES